MYFFAKLFVSLFLLTSCSTVLKVETPILRVQELKLNCSEDTEQKFFEDGVFLENRCERKNGVWHGKRKVYYLSGQLYTDSNFCEGLLCGRWKTYHENGVLKSRGQYKNGRPNGAWLSYYKDGNKFSSGKFKNGCKDGIWYFYKENGEKIVKISADYKKCTSKVIKKYKRSM